MDFKRIMDKFLDNLKQTIFGVKDCNCNQRRKDGYHNRNCASWFNAWNGTRRLAQQTLEGSEE